MPETPEINNEPTEVPAGKSRGILPKEPNPNEPALPPQFEVVSSQAGRAKGARKTRLDGSSFS